MTRLVFDSSNERDGDVERERESKEIEEIKEPVKDTHLLLIPIKKIDMQFPLFKESEATI